MRNCRECEYIDKDQHGHVCRFVGPEYGSVVFKHWEERPKWCPADPEKPTTLTEAARKALFQMYLANGEQPPLHLWPKEVKVRMDQVKADR